MGPGRVRQAGHLEARRQVLEVRAGRGLVAPLRVLDPADLELRLDLAGDRVRLAALQPQHARQQHARFALETRVAVTELEPRRRQRLDRGAVERRHFALEHARADVLAVAAGVAEQRAAHRAGNAGGVRQPGQAAVAALEDERGEVRAALDVRHGAVELDPLAGVAHHQPAQAVVGDEQVAAAADQVNRQRQFVRGAQRGNQRLRRARGDEEVGGTADAKGRVVAQRLAGEQLGAEDLAQARVRVVRGRGHARHGAALSRGGQIATVAVAGVCWIVGGTHTHAGGRHDHRDPLLRAVKLSSPGLQSGGRDSQAAPPRSDAGPRQRR